jgi:hypothetical protein
MEQGMPFSLTDESSVSVSVLSNCATQASQVGRREEALGARQIQSSSAVSLSFGGVSCEN